MSIIKDASGVAEKFAPSPILLPSKIVGAAADAIAGSDDHSDKKNKFLSEHKAITPYLAMVARSAANAGIDPAFQAAVLAQENGGFDRWSTNAVSSAQAHGIAQFIPSTWAGDWNPYRNKSPNDPKYAIPAQSIFLRRLLREANGNMQRAAGLYYGAQDPAYTGGVRNYYNQLQAAHVFDSAGKSILSGIGDAAGDVLHTLEKGIPGVGAAMGVSDLIDTLLHPSKFGELLAKVSAIFLKFVGKAIWDYVLAPPFHWCQRAVIYYFENIMGSKDAQNEGFYYDYAAAATVAFWAVGYGILWRDSEDYSVSAKDNPDNTAFGKGVGFGSSLLAKRKVASPDKVAKATPSKPEPVKSQATVAKVKDLSAIRRRQVRIGTGGNNGRDNETQQTDAPTESVESEAASIAEAA